MSQRFAMIALLVTVVCVAHPIDAARYLSRYQSFSDEHEYDSVPFIELELPFGTSDNIGLSGASRGLLQRGGRQGAGTVARAARSARHAACTSI